MKTIVLPGFSEHNREWAEEIKAKVKLNHLIEVIYWEHWSKGGGLKLAREKKKILDLVGEDKLNLIAKSVGTRVTMAILPLLQNQIEKIILCGIPSISVDYKEAAKKAFADFPSSKVICFQNTKDPFARFAEVKVFMKDVNPNIQVVEKPRKDHNYPYFEDMERFLS